MGFSFTNHSMPPTSSERYLFAGPWGKMPSGSTARTSGKMAVGEAARSGSYSGVGRRVLTVCAAGD